MNDKAAAKPKLEVMGISVVARISRAGAFEGDLSFVGEGDAVFTLVRHETLGAGVRVAWKNEIGAHIFVPITNIARIAFRERVDKPEPKD